MSSFEIIRSAIDERFAQRDYLLEKIRDLEVETGVMKENVKSLLLSRLSASFPTSS